MIYCLTHDTVIHVIILLKLLKIYFSKSKSLATGFYKCFNCFVAL